MLNCPECSVDSRIMGFEVQGVYDGVLYWQCMECGHAWPREWPAGGRRHRIANEMVEEINSSRDE
jgi:Zn ribbon nucleic-acid-binding protein